MRVYAHSLPLARRFALVLFAFVSAHAAGQSSDPTALVPPDAPVRLPWSEVLKLLERSGHRDEAPPRRAVVGAATAEGEATTHGLTVRVALPLLLLDDDWAADPIWGSEVTIRRATLDGQPASFAVESGAHVLLARGKGPHTLSAELVLAAGGSGAQATVPFATPTPVSWKLVLPGNDARIDPAVRQSSSARGEQVTLSALTPPVASVQVSWSAERGTAVPARVSAESLTAVTFQEGTTSGRARFAFEVSRGHREQLEIHLPADLELLTAEAADLAGWSVERNDQGKKLVVRFRRPQRGHLAIDFTFELPRPGSEATVPAPYAEDVTEQRAYVAASAESPLSLREASLVHGEQVDPRLIPAHLARAEKSPLSLAWRHAGEPGFAAKVHLDRHEAVALAQATIDAAYFTTVLTEEGREVVKATFLVKNNLRPYLGVTLPDGAELWSAFVSGDSVAPARDGSKVLVPLVKSRDLGEGDTLAVHVVQAGWSLSDIALQHYHDASKWRVIEEANADLLSGRSLEAGTELRIPRLTGPGASDLQTAFPVEVVYARTADRPGRFGRATFALAEPDLDVMKVTWTLYLPSRLDPLSFGGNLSQGSYIRYGLFRRLQQWGGGPQAAVVMPGLISTAWASAGGGSLKQRFNFSQDEGTEGALEEHPRERLPLVGRPYVFHAYLAGERPVLTAVYLDRGLEGLVHVTAFAFGLLGALGLCATASRRRAWVRWSWVGAGAGVVLFAGHYVLGTHARAALGAGFGAWIWIFYRLSTAAPGGVASRRMLQALKLANAAVLLLIVVTGVGPGRLFLAATCAGLGAVFLWRGTRIPIQAPAAATAAAATTIASALVLVALALSSPARAQEPGLPPGAEVTVPFKALKALVAPGPGERKAPRRYSLLSARYEGAVVGESVELSGVVELEVHGPGWVEIPLIPREETLAQLSLDGAPHAAAVVDGDYRLVFQGAGRHRVALSFVAPVHDPGAARLGLVPGVASALSVRLPSGGLEPMLTGVAEERVEDARITGLVPPAGVVELLWSTRPQAGPDRARSEAELRMTARTLQIASVGEQRTYALARFRVQRGSASQFTIRLPPGAELLDVQGQNVADHQLVEKEGRRLLVVTTSMPVRDEYEISFAYEWRAQRTEPLVLPIFSVAGVRSESGTLGIEAAGGTEIQLAGVEGATAIDVRGAPELFAHTEKPILHAVRYLQQPYSVALKLSAHPEIPLEAAAVNRAQYTTVIARDGRAISQGLYRLRNARRPFLGVSLPAGSEVQSVLVEGNPAKPVRDAGGKLLVALPRSGSADREMRELEVEVVYLTQLGSASAGELPPLLPAVDLRVSKVSWELYLPPGMEVTRRGPTEESADSMQWASAPRALWAMTGAAARGPSDALATGGVLPVRLNLPVHGKPERFWHHYLPAGDSPRFDVVYARRSLPPWVHGLGAMALLVAMALAALGGRAAWARVRGQPDRH
ncbi:MAG TPA: hypothetical protein VND93_17820 [Myxococcales bacterium]|nr:hypothetical protein [Myxococcales bacterium]